MPREVSPMSALPNGVAAKPYLISMPAPPLFISPGDAASSETQRSCNRPGPDKPALANCALQFNDVDIAEKTLRRVNEKAHQIAEFHVAAARLAEAKRKSAEAEGNWAKAVGLAPENKSYQLQLGLALLPMEATAKREAG